MTTTEKCKCTRDDRGDLDDIDLDCPQHGVPECAGCKETGMHPSHNGSRMCESGSIASGGTRAHCTCDACF